MNDGRVCVSVHGENAADLLSLLRAAEPLADVVELRLDGLGYAEVQSVLEDLRSEKHILLTMRPEDEGGRAKLTLSERIEFWADVVRRITGRNNVWIDHEHDLLPHLDSIPGIREHLIVRSKHFFDDSNPDLEAAYNTVTPTNEVVKIAAATGVVSDAIGVWKLLKRAVSEGRRMVPIAMGEAGKWTRILGPAHGAFMTYAALDVGSETAAGQIAVGDLTETFRVRELDKETRVFGIIAGNTSYSISPWMHNAAFRSAGMKSVFIPLQTDNLESFLRRMVLPDSREVELNFGGFSVTNPHKEAIIPFLDEVDAAARKIGAVNTVKIDEKGRLHGYNTDAHGFISTLKNSYGGDLADEGVAVLGAGGAARACVHALVGEGAAVTIVARNEAKGRALADEFGANYKSVQNLGNLGDEFDIVVNTTPLGTAGPGENGRPLAGVRLDGIQLLYDLVYNPAETRLMRDARAAGVRAVNGMDMLIAQGARQFEIWNGLDAPVSEMRAAVERRIVA